MHADEAFRPLCDDDPQRVYEIVLPLFADVRIRVTADTVTHQKAEDRVLVAGHVVGAPDQQAYLAVDGACSGGRVRVSGSVQRGSLLYELLPTDSGHSDVRVIDPRRKRIQSSDAYRPPAAPEVVPAGRATPRRTPGRRSGGGGRRGRLHREGVEEGGWRGRAQGQARRHGEPDQRRVRRRRSTGQGQVHPLLPGRLHRWRGRERRVRRRA